MIYNLTEKLKFNNDPVLTIKDTELTIKSDAEVVLKLMDVLSNKGEIAGAVETMNLLLSPADQKKLNGLHLKTEDYIMVMQTAVQLAMGADPDEESQAGE